MDKKRTIKLLAPEVVAGIKRLDLIARYVVEGFVSGMHRSPFHGFSVEFSDHRQYVKGDDVKYIDWKLYGRTSRYYIKRFMEETNLICYILLDISNSMKYKSAGKVSKQEYACYVAAALSYLMIKQQDLVSLTLFNDNVFRYIHPGSTKNHLKDILKILQTTGSSAGTNIGDRLSEVAEQGKKRGLIILVSDLLEDPEKIIQGLRHLRYKKHDIIIIQILDENELELNYRGKVQFKDLETGEEVITMPQYIREEYQTRLRAMIESINRESKSLVIDYYLIKTTEDLGAALRYYLSRRK